MRQQVRSRLTFANVIALVALLVFALACCLAIGGGQALAAQVKCGDTVTTDTKLHNDLVNCPNNGIAIGANNVTLDLNGHRIDSDGTPAVGCDPETEFCDIGVVNDGHDGVTIEGGKLREFGFGVFTFRARKNRLRNLWSSRNSVFGVFIVKSTHSRIKKSSFAETTSAG